MVVSNVQQASLFIVAIGTDKIVVGFVRHIRRRDRNVFVARNVDATRVIHFVIGTRGNREGRDVALPMVKDRRNIGREYALMVITAFHRGVRPPQKMAWG